MSGAWLQLLRFGVVGSLNTGVDLAAFSLLVYAGVPYLLAQCASFLLGTCNSYWLNRRWTFRRKDAANAREGAKFLILNVLTLAATSALLALLHQAAGWPVIGGKLGATAAGFVLNYAGNRLWVFESTEARSEPR